MNFNKEEFNKLKQLDRIEFRQRRDKIDNFTFGSLTNLLNTSLILSLIFIVAFISNSNNLLLRQYAILFLFLTVFIFILNTILIVGEILLKNKSIKELEEEYFKIEVKK